MRSPSPASSVGTSAAMYTTSQREMSLGALLKRMRFRLAARQSVEIGFENREILTVEAAYQDLVAVIADNTKPARCDGNPEMIPRCVIPAKPTTGASISCSVGVAKRAGAVASIPIAERRCWSQGS